MESSVSQTNVGQAKNKNKSVLFLPDYIKTLNCVEHDPLESIRHSGQDNPIVTMFINNTTSLEELKHVKHKKPIIINLKKQKKTVTLEISKECDILGNIEIISPAELEKAELKRNSEIICELPFGLAETHSNNCYNYNIPYFQLSTDHNMSISCTFSKKVDKVSFILEHYYLGSDARYNFYTKFNIIDSGYLKFNRNTQEFIIPEITIDNSKAAACGVYTVIGKLSGFVGINLSGRMFLLSVMTKSPTSEVGMRIVDELVESFIKTVGVERDQLELYYSGSMVDINCQPDELKCLKIHKWN